ncbi:MAG TPA: carbohydrate binding domain-containing protein [candidate division Zixibacteria bacterium]|nr:carbohydrate binding domain-containing protein [candidate division Zixibacteria bacterium]
MKLIINLLILFTSLLAGINMASATGSLPFERILYVNEWGDTFDSKLDIDNVISKAMYMHSDALMVQIGSEYFEAERDPINKGSWDSRASWNMLEYFINKAHANNIQVHVWIPVTIVRGSYRAESKLFGTQYNQIYRSGAKVSGRTDLAFKELQDYEIGLLTFIAKKYPNLDGIHIEEPFYITQSYSTAMRARVKAKYGYDPLTKPADQMVPIINDVARDVFNEFFKKLRASINTNKANPKLLLSANAFNGYRAVHGFSPNYMSDNHLLDWYAAQISTTTLSSFKSSIDRLKNEVNDIPVVPIVYITYTSIYPNTNPAFIEEVKKTCEYGGHAEAVFAYAWKSMVVNGVTAYKGLNNFQPSSMCDQSTPLTSNISAPTLPTGSSIINPGFESGTASWNFFTNGAGSFGVASPGIEGINAAKLTLTKGGTNIQLNQNELTLEPNILYKLTFSAYSTTGHDLTLRLIKDISPYTNYGLEKTVNLGTSWQTFSIEFTTQGFSGIVDNGRLLFWISSFAAAGDVYYIDNVKLEKVNV